MKLGKRVLRDDVRDVLIERIVEGTYVPGERLVESQLALEFGVSQAPIREALRDLEALRFVESAPYKGARVRGIPLEELAEIYPVRAALESLAAKLLVESGESALGSEVDTALRKLLQEMLKAAQAGDHKGLLTADASFHRTVVEGCGNSTLLDLWSTLRIEASTLMSLLGAGTDLKDIALTHEALVDALQEGDGDAAAGAFHNHICLFERRVRALLDERSEALSGTLAKQGK